MEELERLHIAPTRSTPEIDLNPTGVINIKGASIAENPESFYQPIIDWLDIYLKNPKPRTIANFFFYFFNTSSAMRILDIFKRLKRLSEAKKEVIIRWFFIKGDEDMLEAGEDYQTIIELPFEFIAVDSKDFDFSQIN